MIGVSGLLSRNEGGGGGGGGGAQPHQSAACWSAAAAYFGAAEWWSLEWGAPQLGALSASFRTRDADINFVGAFSLRAEWSAANDAARAAGGALATRLIATSAVGARPICLLGVSLGARA